SPSIGASATRRRVGSYTQKRTSGQSGWRSRWESNSTTRSSYDGLSPHEPTPPRPTPCWRRHLNRDVRAEIRCLGRAIGSPSSIDLLLGPNARPSHSAQLDPIVRATGKTPVADRGVERDRLAVER